MSEILVVHRVPYQVTPLDDWIPEVADRVTLVTAVETHAQYAGRFPRVIGIPDYADGPGVEAALNRVVEERPISTLVHVTEDDVLRAARTRERHGLPGARPADVTPWRDKYPMKQAVSAAGVPTAQFTVPPGAGAARDFAARVGWPVVVKPRLGMGSHGVSVVRDGARLAELARGWDPDDVLLESFVPGDVYHVDGFAQDGKVLFAVVSRYLNGCLAFQDGAPLGSVQLGPSDADLTPYTRFAEQVVEALPPLDFTPFHLEVFRRPDGELVFCEIACRLGGAHIMEELTHLTGVNPARLWIRHQLGLDHGPSVPLADSGKRYGWLLIPPRAGRLVEIRRPEGVTFITDFVVKTSVPRVFDGAHGSTDSIIGYVVEGADGMEVERNLRRCVALTEELVTWEAVR
jgi:ATP-grasp domain